MQRQALFLALVAATLGLGCAGSAPLESPAERAVPGTPVGRAERIVAARVSYAIREIVRSPDGTSVDLTLHNGTSRAYRSLMLRVIAHGATGEERSVRAPCGGIAPGQSRALSARFPALAWRIHDLEVELIWAED